MCAKSDCTYAISLTLDSLVAELLRRCQVFDVDVAQARNLIDPVAAGLESVLHGLTTRDEWHKLDLQRAQQKNMMNAIGDLQQSIIGELPGWICHATGTDMPDVVGGRGRQNFIAEIKNKHNTMNSKSAAATYDDLSEFLERPEFSGFTAIVVTMVSPSAGVPYWKPFAPGSKPARNDILIMSGRVFYAFATDEAERMPYANVRPYEDLQSWSSWCAIEHMLDDLWKAIRSTAGNPVPAWIERLGRNSFG